MKKQNDIAPRKPMTLEEQFLVVSGALNRATQTGNPQAIKGLAVLLRSYEKTIAERNAQQ